MPNLGGWEIVAIVVLIFLLFGAKKLPDAARGLGRSLRIFKSEIKDPNDQEGRDTADDLPPAATQQQSIAASPTVVATPVPPPPVAQPVAPVAPTEQSPAQPSSTDR